MSMRRENLPPGDEPNPDACVTLGQGVIQGLPADTAPGDAIDVTVSEQRGEIALLIHASPDDLGRLIGRRGRVIQAVRQVARAAGSVDGVRVSVEVAE